MSHVGEPPPRERVQVSNLQTKADRPSASDDDCRNEPDGGQEEGRVKRHRSSQSHDAQSHDNTSSEDASPEEISMTTFSTNQCSRFLNSCAVSARRTPGAGRGQGSR